MSGNDDHKILSTKSLPVIIVIGFLVLAVFFVLLIRPATMSVLSLDRKIAELELQQEKQKRLMPTYERLASRVSLEISPELAMGKTTYFPKEDIAEIIPIFKELANEARVTVLSVSPRLETLDQTPGFLAVEMVIIGEYLALRELLLSMARLSYMAGIETVSVSRPRAGWADKHITLKMWVMTTT